MTDETEVDALRAENERLRKELEEAHAALDADPDGSGFWRFWSQKASEYVARATTAEAKLEEAAKVLERAKSLLGQAEWGSPKDAESILQEVIDDIYPAVSSFIQSIKEK